MPHLQWAGRYWRVGSDDVPMLIIFTLVMRMAWLVLLSVALYFSVAQATECAYGFYGLPLYLGITILLFAATIINGIRIMSVGLTGLIFESEKRFAMNRHLTLQIGIVFLEVLSAIFGMVVFFEYYRFPCFENTTHRELLLILVVVISQFVDIIVSTCCCCSIKSHKTDDICVAHDDDDYDDDNDINQAQRQRSTTMMNDLYQGAVLIWIKRCEKLIRRLRLASCCILGGNQVMQEDLEAVARILTKFFHHEGFLDIVPGDVIAGLKLVHMQQRSAMDKASRKNPIFNAESCDVVTKEGSNNYTNNNNNIEVDNQLNGSIKSSGHNTPRDLLIHATSDSKMSEIDSAECGESSNSSKSLSVHSSSPRISEKRFNRMGSFRLIGNDFLYGGIRGAATVRSAKTRRPLDRDSVDDKTLMEDLSDLMPYCLSVYSAFYLALMNPCTFSCRILGTGIRQSGKLKGNNVIIQGDRYGWHQAAAMHHLRDVNELKTELVYGNFKNDVLASPYCVFVDHEKRRVVVAFRGTMSIEDAVTDGIANTVEMKEVGKKWGFDGHDRFAHEGFLKSADFIRTELEDNKVLDKVFADDRVNSGASGDRHDENDTYDLSVVGHSLGAALASLVAIMLRPKYPLVKCVAFAPPALIFDHATAEECKDFIVSVVLGDDCVPRLNFFSLCHMRERVMDALIRAKIPKSTIFRMKYQNFDEEEMFFTPEDAPYSEFKKAIDIFKREVHKHHADDDTPQCTAPGRIIQLVQTGSEIRGCTCKERQEFTAFETTWESLLEIPVSRYSLDHHWPERYCDHLNDIRESWGIPK